jgi:hypothetical protein
VPASDWATATHPAAKAATHPAAKAATHVAATAAHVATATAAHVAATAAALSKHRRSAPRQRASQCDGRHE